MEHRDQFVALGRRVSVALRRIYRSPSHARFPAEFQRRATGERAERRPACCAEGEKCGVIHSCRGDDRGVYLGSMELIPQWNAIAVRNRLRWKLASANMSIRGSRLPIPA